MSQYFQIGASKAQLEIFSEVRVCESGVMVIFSSKTSNEIQHSRVVQN